jgi:uncharacterized membrane protein YdbT with pleckstrin-like domain
MICRVCGAQVSAGNKFCSRCGSSVAVGGPPESGTGESQFGTRQEEVPERPILSFRPALLFVGIAYAVAAFLWIAITALVAAASAQLNLGRGPGAIAVITVGIVIFAYPGLLHLRRQRYRYTLTNYKIEVQTGILARTTRNILLGKIQDVTVTSTILKRMVGIGDIVLETAGEAGRVMLRNVPNAKRNADIILRELQRWN